MILINNLMLSLDADFENLTDIAVKTLRIDKKYIVSTELHKKSVDARHKNDIKFCCSILVKLNINEENVIKKIKNAQIYTRKEYDWYSDKKESDIRPIVVGFGPAGMFAALRLARAGLKPIVLERGGDADSRKKAVEKFFSEGKLDTENNVQFGEGGAGTFSDGKLNTGTKDFRQSAILETFYEFGADKKILTDAKAHIGTDILINIVKNIRKEIISLGGEVCFFTKLDELVIKDRSVVAVKAAGKLIPANWVILATGHSARDIFEYLAQNNIEMVRKPFSVGVRIEHLQSDINKALYGDYAEHKALSAADYKLSVHLPNGRGVYTFCMCPGGEVINASSEEGGIAVNGMSNSRRDGKNANSALLVGLNPEDFSGDNVLAGCYFQREIEKRAFSIANGAVPVMTVGKFVFGKEPEKKISATVKPKTANCDFSEIFPNFIIESLKEGILAFDKKIKGFADESALLTAPETRSSSPVRILRNEKYESVSVKGLYPCGEGAGYAGGIMSAAVDGLRIAEQIISEI